MTKENPIQDEIEFTRKMFNLEELLNFQINHNLQIHRGSDYQYHCYIDGDYYGVSLTPMMALVYGVTQFKEKLKNENKRKEREY